MRCQIVDSSEPDTVGSSHSNNIYRHTLGGSLYRPEIIFFYNNVPHAAGSAPDTSSCACMTNFSP